MSSLKQLVLLLLFWGLTLVSYAQQPNSLPFPLDPKTQRITYTEEVPLAGTSFKELLLRAQAWVQAIPQDQLAGHETGVGEWPTRPGQERKGSAIGYGARLISYTVQGTTRQMPVYYTIRLLLRAGTYRYEVTDFYLGYGYPGGPAERFLLADTATDTQARYPGFPEQVAAVRAAFPPVISSIITDLRKDLAKPITETKSSH